jgi:hypothetical protein
MNGMANIAAREGAVMHGVAHLVTPQVGLQLRAGLAVGGGARWWWFVRRQGMAA